MSPRLPHTTRKRGSPARDHRLPSARAACLKMRCTCAKRCSPRPHVEVTGHACATAIECRVAAGGRVRRRDMLSSPPAPANHACAIAINVPGEASGRCNDGVLWHYGRVSVRAKLHRISRPRRLIVPKLRDPATAGTTRVVRSASRGQRPHLHCAVTDDRSRPTRGQFPSAIRQTRTCCGTGRSSLVHRGG